MKNKGILFVVSGPSGAGKGTICKALIEKRKDLFLSISATTRKPRPGEVDGVNYYFLSEEEFLEKIKNNGFLEHAFFCGNYYGTPKDKVYEKLSQGIDVILEIEVQGAMKVRAEHPEAVFIFVLPPSMKELKERLINRNTEPIEIINQRLNTAAFEIGHIKNITISY